MPRGINQYDEAQIQGRLWTPEVLRPKSWHDASDISTITITGSGVSDWRDKSGNGITLSQSTDAERPSLSVAGRSGLSAMKFSTPGYLTGQSINGSAPFSSGSEMSVVWAIKQPPSSSTNYPWNWAFAPDANRCACSGPFQISGISYYDWNGFSGSNRISGVGPAYESWSIQWARNSVLNGSKSTYLNGASSPFASALSGSSATLSFYRIGKGPETSPTYSGIEMGEILVFDHDISVYAARLVEGYLSRKWGIPLAADHPFANRPPLIGD